AAGLAIEAFKTRGDGGDCSSARAIVPGGMGCRSGGRNFALRAPPRPCAHDVADTGGLPLNRSKPNSVRASKWITATSACQVKFRCEQPRPARAGHSCENI